MKNNQIFILFFLSILIFLSSCTKSQKNIIRIAHNQGKEHPTHLALLQFEQKIEERTNERYDLQVFPNELLGGQRETVELTQTGAIDIAVGSISLLESFNKAYSVFNLPYLFNSREHFFSVMNDPNIMNSVYQSTRNAGFVGITWLDAGSRNFYTTQANHPIMTPEDLKGLKIRVQQSPTNIRMMELLGGSATPMSYGEVYTALQQKVIDGAENNETALTRNKHGEVAKYFSYNHHAIIPDILIMNAKRLYGFDADTQKIFLDTAKEMNLFQVEAWKEEIQVAVKEAKVMGVQFYYPEILPFKEKVLPLHHEITQDPIIKNIYEQIQEKGN